MAIMVNTGIDNLHSQFRTTPGPGKIGNTRFRFDDIGTAAAGACLMQSPSFPAHQRKLHEQHNIGVCRTPFGMMHITTDNYIRRQLEGVGFQGLCPVFDYTLQQLGDAQGFKVFWQTDDWLPTAQNSSLFHSSGKIHCAQCTHTALNRVTRYHHDLICIAVMSPGPGRLVRWKSAQAPRFIPRTSRIDLFSGGRFVDPSQNHCTVWPFRQCKCLLYVNLRRTSSKRRQPRG